MAELILYAVPTGPLADQLAACFTGLTTEAQRYPPHCTLTGFFHDDEVARYVAAAGAAASTVDVAVEGLRDEAGWIGLELRSPDLVELTGRFADAVAVPCTRTDTIRPKTWLHVSIAYGHHEQEHEALAARAERMVDPSAPCRWALHLYERVPSDRWVLHGDWSLA